MTLDQDIVREATRLTRAGKLVEATALLQRMLRGAGAPGAAGRPVAQREAPVIDLKATIVGKTEAPQLVEATATRRRRQPAPLDRSTGGRRLELRDLVRRAPSQADIIPDGARFIGGSYRNLAGSRTYKLFIPSRYQKQPLPLVVMLHGCTQSPEDFAAGTRMNFIAEEQNCIVVYPEQPSGANHAKCWNWFRAGDQLRGNGEPSLIAGITRQVMQEYSVDPKRVYVGGLSAGGAAAAIMASTYSDLYAAVGIHSGLACGAAKDVSSAFVAMRQGDRAENAFAGAGSPIPTIVFHGDRDTTVYPANGDRIIELSLKTKNLKRKEIRGRVSGGHEYSRVVFTDPSGRSICEHWSVLGAGHAWSGGSPAGSYTDPRGPDATREMLRFFLEHSR